jgi:hypothetical protein
MKNPFASPRRALASERRLALDGAGGIAPLTKCQRSKAESAGQHFGSRRSELNGSEDRHALARPLIMGQMHARVSQPSSDSSNRFGATSVSQAKAELGSIALRLNVDLPALVTRQTARYDVSDLAAWGAGIATLASTTTSRFGLGRRAVTCQEDSPALRGRSKEYHHD